MSARSHAVYRMHYDADRLARPLMSAAEFHNVLSDSNSDRRIGFGRRASSTHQLLLRSTGRTAITESGIEAKFARIFDVDPTISDIEEQPPVVRLTPEISHRPDFRLTFSDGTKIVVAIRPTERAKPQFVAEVALLHRICRSTEYADAAIWLSETDLDPICVQNAQTIDYARSCLIDEAVIERVKCFLAGRNHTTSRDSLNIHPLAIEAAWIAVSRGFAEPSTATPRLDHRTILVPPKQCVNLALRVDFGAHIRQQTDFSDRGLAAYEVLS